MGREGEITPLEKTIVAQLRERVKNELPKWFDAKSEEDQKLYLARWARARDLHVEHAAKMLRHSLEWRRERKADEILEITLHPFFKETFPYTFAGTDSHGHPVILVPLSDWDFRKVVNDKEKLPEFDDFVTHTFESFVNQIDLEHAKRTQDESSITQFTMVMNTKGYPYGQLISFGAIKKLLQMASTYEAHYPEVLFRAIFVNCPSYFGMFISLLKPVLAPKTLGKITCFSQMSEWQKELEGWIDPAILPEIYGGTKVDEKVAN